MDLKNRTLLVIIVIFRVLITLGIMLTLFLGLWIGYFTVPIILIGVFSIILAISDVGVLFSLRKKGAVPFNVDRSERTPDKNITHNNHEY